MRLLRRLRGALSTGLTWAVTWGMLGAVHGFLIGAFKPWQWDFYNPITTTALGYAIAGLIAGASFSGLLAWLDRRANLDQLSRVRVALWGAAGGAFVPVLVHLTRGLTSSAGWSDVALTASVTGVLGSVSALATLWVARRGTEEAGIQAESELIASPAPDWSRSFADARAEYVHARSRADA